MKPYYEHDGITIYHGDNVATMAALEPDSIDLVVTSPPYDNLREYGGHSWDFEGVAQQLRRLIKPGGVVVWVVADATVDGSETGTSFSQALRFKEIGFRLHDTMIWDKQSFCMPEIVRYQQSWEFMFVLSKGLPTRGQLLTDRLNVGYGRKRVGTIRQANGDTLPGRKTVVAKTGLRYNVWDRQPCKTATHRKHPAAFPESLARDHILSWSNEGDTVLDPFNGSGTTPKMSKLMGRKAIGIEIEEKYCEIAANRLAQGVLPFA